MSRRKGKTRRQVCSPVGKPKRCCPGREQSGDEQTATGGRRRLASGAGGRGLVFRGTGDAVVTTGRPKAWRTRSREPAGPTHRNRSDTEASPPRIQAAHGACSAAASHCARRMRTCNFTCWLQTTALYSKIMAQPGPCCQQGQRDTILIPSHNSKHGEQEEKEDPQER